MAVGVPEGMIFLPAVVVVALALATAQAVMARARARVLDDGARNSRAHDVSPLGALGH